MVLVRHPHFEIEVEQDDRYIDLVSDGFDLAIRIGELRDSALIARRLAPIRRVVVCSPDYAERRGVPREPRDLLNHECLIYTNATPAEQWRFMVSGRWESFRTGGRFRSNNAETLRDGALKGLGLAASPTFIVGTEIKRGSLVPVLTEFPMRESTLYALFPPSRRLTAKVRVVVDFLADRFGLEPYWDLESRPG